jgi:hypothetical protein
MAGSPNFTIVNSGLAVASTASPTGPWISIEKFSINAGYGYTPAVTQLAPEGALLFEGTPTSYQNVGGNTIDILCEIPPNAGPFQFGEVALYLPGNVLFAIAVFQTPQTKFSALGSNVVSSYELHCLLTLAQGTAIFQVSTTVPITLLQVYNWSDVYPPSVSANPGVPLLQVMEPSEFGDSTLLMNSNSNTWTIGSTYARYNQHNDAPSFQVANASTTWIEVLATDLNILDLTTINERFVLETPDNYFRSVSSVVISGSNYRFNLNGTPLQTVPSIGSTISVYRDDLARGDSYYSQILDPLNYDITNLAMDTGTVNAYAATYKQKDPIPSNGLVRCFIPLVPNTGASTFALDGGSPYPIYGLAGMPLQGSEVAGITAMRFSTALNTLATPPGAWVVLNSIDGPLQVPNALHSQHAMTLGQSNGRLLRTSIYALVAGVLNVSINGLPFVVASSTFTPLPLTTLVDVEVQGGGGAGGGCPGVSPGYVAAGAGGGAGGYARGMYSTGFSGALITVGPGGTGTYGNGNAGGTSSFGNLISATGGGGGNYNGPTLPTNNVSGGSAGGTGHGGTINGAGAGGMYAFLADPTSGSGASTIFGAGGPYVSSTAAANNALSYGAGGSGSASYQYPNPIYGGNGFMGLVIVREYY